MCWFIFDFLVEAVARIIAIERKCFEFDWTDTCSIQGDGEAEKKVPECMVLQGVWSLAHGDVAELAGEGHMKRI